MRTRKNQILIRLDDEELKKLKGKIEKTKLTQSEYLRIVALDSEFLIFENTQEFLIELKRIGNNLNQLTRAVNMGKINCEKELEVLTGEVKNLWLLLKLQKVEEV